MPLTRQSKWQKHTKPTKEKGMHEERAEFWQSLMFPKQYKKPKEKKKPQKKHYELTLTVRDAVKKRDHNSCQVCGREATSLHHIILRSQGGKNHIENLVSLCTEHHTGPYGPHQSDDWRRFWESWSKQRYPEYWEVRKKA